MAKQTPTLPKQINPRQPKDTAVAPYNFVPLPDEIVSVAAETLPDQDRYYPTEPNNSPDHEDLAKSNGETLDGDDVGRHTGIIHCRLVTETPLYVRAALCPNDYAKLDSQADKAAPYHDRVKNRPEFFYTDWNKEPVIPGSSLRGMVRAVVEMASHSKFGGTSDQKLVYRSVGDTTSHGENYRRMIMTEDATGYDEDDKRYLAYTPRVQAGYLVRHNGGYQIQPARQIGGTTFARIHHQLLRSCESRLRPVPGTNNAHYIYIQSGPWDYQRIRGGLIRMRYAKTLRASDRPGNNLFQGVLARSGAIFSKRTEAVVFPPDINATSIEVDDALAESYIDQLSQEQKNLLGEEGVLTLAESESERQDGQQQMADDDFPIVRQPVFYLLTEEGDLNFFGHTMMMRLPYKHSPLAMIPAHLRQEETIDLTEAIFGYSKSTGEEKERAYAGRVFFGDAHLDKEAHPDTEKIWFNEKKPVVPKILSGPKATAFQQYLVQTRPDPEVTGHTRDGRPKYDKELADYNADEDQTTLRGQKLYWHKASEITLADIHEPVETLKKMQRNNPDRHLRDSQYTQITPVQPGVQFNFDLRFENLSDVELGALLWALTIPGDAGEAYRHKLGMAKPYGLGTVQIIPTLVLQDRQQRYTQLFATDEEGQLCWEEGSVGETTLETEELIDRFETHILKSLYQDDKTRPQRLHEVHRLRVLLSLMRWPGPGPQERETRYMEIERPDPNGKRGKVNEYRNRPVLPSPLPTGPQEERAVVAAPPSAVFSTSEPTRAPKRSAVAADFAAFLRGKTAEEEPPTADEQATTQPVVEHPVDQPASAKEIKSGHYLEGTVNRVEQERVVVDLNVPGSEEASLLIERIVPPIDPATDWESRFPAGSTIHAWVHRINKRGRVQLTMKEPA